MLGSNAGAREPEMACRARHGRNGNRDASGSILPKSSAASCAPRDIGTEVFFLPAAGHAEKDGCFTNTQRLIQWHDKAVDPPGDARSDAWFVYHLGLD